MPLLVTGLDGKVVYQVLLFAIANSFPNLQLNIICVFIQVHHSPLSCCLEVHLQ